MDEWPEVRLDVDRLMELVPHCAEVYADRAAYFSHYGQHEAALKDLKIAADIDPAKEGVQWSMAHECMELAKYDEAIEAYQRNIQLLSEKERFLSRYNIGIAYKFSGKYEEAIKAFRRCKATDGCPDHITASCNQQINVCKAVLEELGRPSPP
jgi:tetratricopeptide (TPR) repeat protein